MKNRILKRKGRAWALPLLVVMVFVVFGVAHKAIAMQTTGMIISAAKQGDANAQVALGIMYADGDGVLPQDDKQAVYWYRKAAEQGHAGAMFMLGCMYEDGKGVTQDKQQGIYWEQKAAEQGHAGSQAVLGAKYNQGNDGLPQDDKQAVYWYRKAAEQGHAIAQFSLGVLYAKGKGVPQNDVKAYAWSILASAQGAENAVKNRDIVASNLTPEQRSQAQELASEIQAKIDHPVVQKEKISPVNPPSSKKAQKKNQLPAVPSPITVSELQPKSSGTGFVVTMDGYVLTCQHVVGKAASIKIKTADGKIYTAQVVKADASSDIALLKIEGSFQPLAFSANRSAKLGQEVFTIGYPNPEIQGVSAKLTKGDVNSLTGYQDDIRLYQISVPVQPGNSGGPLIDMDGNVDGVIVAMLDAQTAFKVSGSIPQNVNYAVKSTYAQALLDTIPDVSAKLAAPSGKQSFDQTVERVGKSVVMVLAYSKDKSIKLGQE